MQEDNLQLFNMKRMYLDQKVQGERHHRLAGNGQDHALRHHEEEDAGVAGRVDDSRSPCSDELSDTHRPPPCGLPADGSAGAPCLGVTSLELGVVVKGRRLGRRLGPTAPGLRRCRLGKVLAGSLSASGGLWESGVTELAGSYRLSWHRQPAAVRTGARTETAENSGLDSATASPIPFGLHSGSLAQW